MIIKQLNIYFSTFSLNKRVSVFIDYEATNDFCIESFRYLVDNGFVKIY